MSEDMRARNAADDEYAAIFAALEALSSEPARTPRWVQAAELVARLLEDQLQQMADQARLARPSVMRMVLEAAETNPVAASDNPHVAGIKSVKTYDAMISAWAPKARGHRFVAKLLAPAVGLQGAAIQVAARTTIGVSTFVRECWAESEVR